MARTISEIRAEVNGAEPKKRAMSRRKKDTVSFYLYILPFILGFSLFTLVPMGFSLFFSFHKIGLNTYVDESYTFYGFQNYVRVFTDNNYFLLALRNTFTFAIFRNVFCVVIAMLLALLFNCKMPCKKLFRTFIYIPGVLPIVGAAIIWRQLFDGRASLISWALSGVGITVDPNWWLGNGGLVSALIMSVFMGIGQTMTMFLAALQGVPTAQLEAADIDGADAFTKFFRIILPSISPTMFYVVMTGIISSLQAYAEVELLVGSLAKNSMTISYLVMYYYKQNMIGLGYSSAIAWLLFLIIGACSFFVFKYSKKMVFFADGGTL